MRYRLLDYIRGFDLISMIAYHLCWDLVYLCGFHWGWYRSAGVYVWQQSICWIFILLSGFCWSLGKRKLRRGLTVLAASVLVSVVTCVFVPEAGIRFGVLTLLGSSMLLLIPLDRLAKKLPPTAGMAISAALFFVFRNVNLKTLGFERLSFCALPKGLYRNLLTAYFGFPSPDFASTDYFSLIPWFFLFLCGYFLYRKLEEAGVFRNCTRQNREDAGRLRISPVEFLGRRSLIIYLLHQPLLYLICVILLR